MTSADKPAFAQAFARLAVAHREKDLDAVAVSVYFTALQAREIEFVVAAAERLATNSAWFPKVVDWLGAAASIERERLDAQRALLRNLPAPLCPMCDDTSFARNADGRVSRCTCREVRRLEVLGRRPWPVVPESHRLGAGRYAPVDPANTAALMAQIENQTGLKIEPRSMPTTTPASDQLKAAKKVMAEIVASVSRCEELERQVPDVEEVPARR